MWLTAGTFLYIFGKFLQQYNTKIISVHSLHYELSKDHMVGQWHPFKLVIFINNQTNTKSSTHHNWRPSRLPLQGNNITKFTLALPPHTFLAFPLIAMHYRLIFLHVHWSSNSAIHYILTATTYYSTFLHLLISHSSWRWKISWYTD